MSSKIEMPMQLFQYALNAVEYLAMRADDIGSSNVPVADAMRSLLAAPAVERQPVVFAWVVTSPDGKEFSELQSSEDTAKDLAHDMDGDLHPDHMGGRHEIKAVYTAPPELAELEQSVELHAQVIRDQEQLIQNHRLVNEKLEIEVQQLHAVIQRLNAARRPVRTGISGSAADRQDTGVSKLQAAAVRLTASCIEKDGRIAEMDRIGSATIARLEDLRDFQAGRLNLYIEKVGELTAENERLKSESFESLYSAAIDERDALIERLKGGQGEPVVLPTREDFKVWAGPLAYDLNHGENGVFHDLQTRHAWFGFGAGAKEVIRLNASQPAPISVVPSKDLRSQYEAWADTNGYDITRNEHGDYAGLVEDSMWSGWKSKAEHWALPDRIARGQSIEQDVKAIGWNACLDKVKELNQ